MGACSSKQAVVTDKPRSNHEINALNGQGANKSVKSGEKAGKSPTGSTLVQSTPSDDGNISEASATSFSRKTPTNESSGASTPTNRGIDDDSTHHSHRSSRRDRSLRHSASKVGLGEMIDNKKEEGDLKNGMVHMEVPFGKPIEDVYEGVHDGPILGQGIAGLVRLITHKTTGVQYAVKCLDLRLVDTDDGLTQLREEIYIMCQLDHPNIVRLEEVYESETEIYLVQELCRGGELFDRLDEQPDFHYTEAQCARLVKQMLKAVRYIHEKGIIHRDLKLENFLFSNTTPDSELKMIDFGLGKHFQLGEVHHEAVGTPYTVAPEVIRGTYDERCDVWAIGVITYLLLSGDPPFGGCGGPEPLVEVRENILRGEFEFEPKDIWVNVSAQAKQFIKTLLVTDPLRRPTAGQAQRSTWMREWASSTVAHKDRTLNPNVVKALVSFKDYSDMRKLLCEVLSFTLLPDQIEDLRLEFEKMDIDDSGEITLAGLKKVLLTNCTLGALTEAEVEGIFDAMRVRKTETTIHWHEFIAAALSQCKVDDRNLRLAFDRLDSEHKGYITFENMMDLMGHEEEMTEDTMQKIWGDSMGTGNFKDARISYEDFLKLMKGQTLGDAGMSPAAHDPLHTVAETPTLTGEIEAFPSKNENEISGDSTKEEGKEPILLVNDGGGVGVGHVDLSMLTNQTSSDEQMRRTSIGSACSVESGHVVPSISVSAPNTPFLQRSAIVPDNFPGLTIPLSMDEDEDELISEAIDKEVGKSIWAGRDSGKQLSPAPPSPLNGLSIVPTRLELLRRGRSKSVDEQDDDQLHDDEDLSNRPILYKQYSSKLVDQSNYKAHRQMRLAVLEASKILEEEELRRARETLRAEQIEKKKASGVRMGAGLVMVHGQELSSEYVKKFLRQKQKEAQVQVDKANRRSGRGRRSRKKTMSDIGGMLSSPPPGELIMDAVPPPATDVQRYRKTPTEKIDQVPQVRPEKHTHPEESKKPDIPNSPIREPTTPGVFRKTRWDPFILSSPQLQNAKKTPVVSSQNTPRLGKFKPALETLDDSRHATGELDIAKDMTGIITYNDQEKEKIDGPLDWPPPPPL